MNYDNHSVTYQNDAMHSFMVFRLNLEDQLSDYQIKIIKENPVSNLLPLHRKQLNQEVFLCYEITSKIDLEQFLARRKLSRHEFLTIMKSFIKALQIGKNYLLQGGKYVLDAKHIYINPSALEVSVAYLPILTAADIKEDIRKFLVDLIVYKATFANAEEGNFVYRMLALLKSEAFSLEQLDRLASEIAVETGTVGAPMPGENIKAPEKEGVLNTRKTLFLFILIQLLAVVLTALALRLVTKQNQGIDLYSAAGVILLGLSADFLVLKRLGVLNRKKAARLDVRQEQCTPSSKNDGMKKQQKEGRRSKEKLEILKQNQRFESFADIETSVLMEDEAVYAYLTGCHENQQEMIALNKSSFIIGRLKNQADYVATNNAIGKLHAEVIKRDGAYYIKDLNSRNGTYINGERITSNVLHAIKNNDRVTFANSEYKFTWQQGANQS